MAKPITIKITGDASNFSKTLGGVESRLGSFSKVAGKALIGVGTLAAGAVAGIGVGLFKLGTDFDKAFDNLIVGTGASGEALEGLKDDFREVAKTVPSDFGDVSTAVADLNTRLGLTGKPLQDISARMLNLTRLTGGDLQTNIALVTRMFGDAGVATEDQAGALDMVFEATKRTGIGLDRLTTLTTQYGAPLRQMGFGMEQSIALFSKWEQEGVNVETVMAGMRMGLGKLAKAGEEPTEAFARLQEEIKNAETAGDATALAIEAFGQRAGPDMAAAIREGRFEIGELVTALEGSGGALDDAATRTESVGEKFTKFKNRMFLALEPLASLVFDKVGKAFEKAAPYIEAFTVKAAAWIESDFIPAAEKMAEVLGRVVGWIRDNWPTIRAVFETVVAAVVATFETIISWAREHLPPVLEALRAAFAAAVEWVRDNWPAIAEKFEQVREVIGNVVDFIVSAIEWFVDVFKSASSDSDGEASKLMTTFENLRDLIVSTFGAIQVIIETVVAIVTKIWNKWGDEFTALAKVTVGLVIDIVNNLLTVLTGIMDLIKAVLTGKWGEAWDAIKLIASGLWGILESSIVAIVDGIAAVFGGLLDTVTKPFRDAFKAAKDFVMTTAKDGLASAGTAVGNAFVDGISGALNGLTDLGGKIADGVIGAFKAGWNIAAGYINEKIPNSIPIPFAPDIDLPDNPVPMFGNGAVVSRATLAVVGEVPGETEIVTPEKLMRRIIREEGGARGGGSPIYVEQHFHGFSTDEARRLAREGTEEVIRTAGREMRLRHG